MTKKKTNENKSKITFFTASRNSIRNHGFWTADGSGKGVEMAMGDDGGKGGGGQRLGTQCSSGPQDCCCLAANLSLK